MKNLFMFLSILLISTLVNTGCGGTSMPPYHTGLAPDIGGIEPSKEEKEQIRLQAHRDAALDHEQVKTDDSVVDFYKVKIPKHRLGALTTNRYMQYTKYRQIFIYIEEYMEERKRLRVKESLGRNFIVLGILTILAIGAAVQAVLK